MLGGTNSAFVGWATLVLNPSYIILTVFVELWAGGDIRLSVEDLVGLTNPVFTIKIAMVILISE